MDRSMLGTLALVSLLLAAGCGEDPTTTPSTDTASATDATAGDTGGADPGAGDPGTSSDPGTADVAEPDTAVPPKCVPAEAGGPVPETCGVFAKPGGNAGAAGTKADPYSTLGEAIQLAAGKPIYACNVTFEEAIALPVGTTLYGGLDCDDWAHVPGQVTTIKGNSDQIPLRIVAGAAGKATVVDFAVVAGNAEATGGSSIAALAAEGTRLELIGVKLVSGSGQPGASGTTPVEPIEPTDPNDESIRGKAGNPSCMGGAAGNFGAPATANTHCPASIGGAGGTAQENEGAQGDPGLPTYIEGFGQGGIASAPGGGGCQTGGTGALGTTGEAGRGAAGMGGLSAEGYTGDSGLPGVYGLPGQGGGGGGPALGKTDCYGASGGGGGAGGCGGPGGSGGHGGGASIGLVSLGAEVTLTDVQIETGPGGAGGAGGEGQLGGVGGNGGPGGTGATGLSAACSGGSGGAGGYGGTGGGGRGGHSIGVAFVGTPPDLTKTTITVGAAGAGGGGNGADGVGGEAVDFTPPGCDVYCGAIASHCVEAHQQYEDEATCLLACAALPAGTAYEAEMGIATNSIGCRTYHAAAAEDDPATHCPHAGPGGGGACGVNCEGFCALAVSACGAEYPDLAACTETCGAFPDDVPYAVGVASGNSLACRLSYLARAIASEDAAALHCPNAALGSPACAPAGP